MLVSDYNYDLPDERIAKFPPKIRGTTRLAVLNRQTGEIEDSFYRNLDQYLNPGDILVINDTKVMQSRLFCHLEDGRKRELVVLEKHDNDPQKVLYRGKLHENDILTINETDITVKIKSILGNGIAEVESASDLDKITEQYGTVPLPPYLHRDATASDKERYQTVWAKQMGSAAAPTASLNMTEELLKKLEQKGIKICYLTLRYKIRVTCGKYNLNIPVKFPDFSCQLNTIHLSHLNIQKQNLKILLVLILKKELFRRKK